MAEILGIGLTHFPPFTEKDDRMGRILQGMLRDPALPEKLRAPEGWPEPMRREYGTDEGKSAALRHREANAAQFRKARRVLDDFAPDFVLIWGDDQYENFKEDIIPAFCVLAYEKFEFKPWEGRRNPNYWDEPNDKAFSYRGHPGAAKMLVSALLERGFDLSYAYQPLHHGLGHAFANALLYLDYDRVGFPYPILPFQVNCYGRRVIAQRGGVSGWGNLPTGDKLDPPSPAPWRCFDLGAAAARALRDSPWRVALIASSSWSHAFLTPKHHLLYPDVEADRALYDALRAGEYRTWRDTSLAAMEDAGQQEMLNWMCLAGAMDALERKPRESAFIETHLFNSTKCFAYFTP